MLLNYNWTMLVFFVFFESIFPISCLQGVDPGLTPVTDPSAYPAVIHGTYASKWEPIKKRGLSRMARNHIHFAPGRRGTLVWHISGKLIQTSFSFHLGCTKTTSYLA